MEIGNQPNFSYPSILKKSPFTQSHQTKNVVASVTFRGVDDVKTYKPFLTKRFEDALVYATQLHANQARKGTPIPYVAHLMGVSSIVMEHGGTEDEIIAGLLHDAVEDQGGAPTLAEIRKRFGDTVADIVAGCSDTDVNPKPPWRTRKEAYIAHVYTTTPSVRLVSAADKLHNIRSILSDYYQEGDKTWEKFKGGKEGSLWYYRELVKAFKATTGNTPLIQELDRHVTLLENLVAASNNKAS